MTVKELREKLAGLPDDALVLVLDDTTTVDAEFIEVGLVVRDADGSAIFGAADESFVLGGAPAVQIT